MILLKFDALSGLVRVGGARPPGAFLFLSPWSLRSPALLPWTAPVLSEGDISLKTVSKGKLKLYPSLEIFFRLSNSNTTHVPHLFLIRKWRIRLLGAVRWPWHTLSSSIYGNNCAVKRFQYQNVQRFPTILESLHVLDLFFPYEISILKLTFFMKHPVGQRSIQEFTSGVTDFVSRHATHSFFNETSTSIRG